MIETRSRKILEKLLSKIPGGVNSPARSFSQVQMDPMIVSSGKGAKIYDVDQNGFIDYCLSWGALILGHAHPKIVKAACEQIEKGSSFGITNEWEEKLASKILEHYKSAEKIRFVNSGTEATMTAMRLARGATNRTKIVKFGGHYHGHHDSLLIQAGSFVSSINPQATSKGVNSSTIADTICLPFNDFETLATFFQTDPRAKEVAGVIVEPIAGNMGVVPAEEGFLELLREKTIQNGSLLIMDEVITGFRVSLLGAGGVYKIDPDLVCFGKIIGAGFPIAAVAGKVEIMDLLAPLGEVYQAGTLSGNPVGMRAGFETLKEIEAPHFYKMLEEKMDRLLMPIEELIVKENLNLCIQRKGAMFSFFFGVKKVRSKNDLEKVDKNLFIRFFHELYSKGIYFSPSPCEACFLSAAHTDEEIDNTRERIIHFLKENK